MLQNDLRPIRSPLVEGAPEHGLASLYPWDQKIFGFAVGGYELGDPTFIAAHRDEFCAALNSWADRHETELLACAVPGDRHDVQQLLNHCGFCAIDFALGVALPAARLRRVNQPILNVRKATPADGPAVMRIAESAFQVGRYHADARFPRTLADLRYRRWMENAFAGLGGADDIYVVDEGEGPMAFMHVVCDGGDADLRLAAVQRESRGGNVGYGLYLGVLDLLRQAQVRQVRSKISAGNVAVVNIYAALGFRFDRPEVVYHWHWPKARHLIAAGKLADRTAPG